MSRSKSGEDTSPMDLINTDTHTHTHTHSHTHQHTHTTTTHTRVHPFIHVSACCSSRSKSGKDTSPMDLINTDTHTHTHTDTHTTKLSFLLDNTRSCERMLFEQVQKRRRNESHGPDQGAAAAHGTGRGVHQRGAAGQANHGRNGRWRHHGPARRYRSHFQVVNKPRGTIRILVRSTFFISLLQYIHI